MPTINIIFNSSTVTVLSVEIYHILKEKKKNFFLILIYTTKCIDLEKSMPFLTIADFNVPASMPWREERGP